MSVVRNVGGPKIDGPGPFHEAPGRMQGVGSKVYEVVQLFKDLGAAISKIVQAVYNFFVSDQEQTVEPVKKEAPVDDPQAETLLFAAEIQTSQKELNEIVAMLERDGCMSNACWAKLEKLPRIYNKFLACYKQLMKDNYSVPKKVHAGTIEFFKKLVGDPTHLVSSKQDGPGGLDPFAHNDY